jgi:ankyrin repeat protein
MSKISNIQVNKMQARKQQKRKKTLCDLVENEQYFEFEKLLESQNVDINAIDSQGVTALMRSCFVLDSRFFKRLIEVGANLNAQDSMGNTALHYVTGSNFSKTRTPYIIKAGANVNIKNDSDETPLAICLSLMDHGLENDHKVPTMLITAGSIISPLDIYYAIDALMPDIALLIIESITKMTQFELKTQFRTTNVFDISYREKIPIIHAVEKGLVDVVTALVKAGCDINIRDIIWNINETALMKAARKDNQEMIMTLLELGADPNITNLNGFTAQDIVKDLVTERAFKKFYRKKVLKDLENALEIANKNICRGKQFVLPNDLLSTITMFVV